LGEGKEGFLLVYYHAELLLIGSTAWSDYIKDDICPHGGKSAIIMVLQTIKKDR
jgi:hypothetical protein